MYERRAVKRLLLGRIITWYCRTDFGNIAGTAALLGIFCSIVLAVLKWA